MRVHIGPYPTNDDQKREVLVEIEPHDTWNLDHTLALVIAPALRRFRNASESFPGDFHRDDDPSGERGLAEWQDTLARMIAAFEAVAAGYTADVETDRAAQKAVVEEGLTLFARYYTHLWE